MTRPFALIPPRPPQPGRPFLVPPGAAAIRMRRFEQEALPFRPDVARAARSLVRERDAAEDLTQEVFFQAWRSFDRFETGTNCRAWLFAILFHRLWHLRRRQSRLVYGEPPADIAAPVPQETAIGSPVLAEALAALPVPLRAVVWLADVEEYSYKEIAARLSIPCGTVMSRLSRGRARLRSALLAAGSQTPSSRPPCSPPALPLPLRAGRRPEDPRRADRLPESRH